MIDAICRVASIAKFDPLLWNLLDIYKLPGLPVKPITRNPNYMFLLMADWVPLNVIAIKTVQSPHQATEVEHFTHEW